MMKNIMWTRQYKIAHKGRPNWNKGINDVYFTMMSEGIFSASVLYFDELTRQPDKAFFRLETFIGTDADHVWTQMDTWVNNFMEGMGGFEYVEK